jgi:MFS family permease
MLLVGEDKSLVTVEEAFPWKLLSIIYLCTVCDALFYEIASPFLTEMCRSRWQVPESWLGLSTGFLLSASSLGACLSSFLMGYISDIMGRKRLVVLGLATGLISLCITVMSPWYSLAALVRFLAGVTNCINAITKAIISDVTRGKNRTIGFAYHSAVYSLARFFASVLGGLLVGIKLPIPVLSIDTNPYFFPAAVVLVIGLAALLLFSFGAPETHKPTTVAQRYSLWEGLRTIGSDKTLRNLIVGFALNSLTNGSLILTIIVVLSMKTEYHGFGYSPDRVAAVMGCFGLVSGIFQFSCFSWVLRKLGLMRLYPVGLSCLAIATSLFSVCAAIYWVFGVSSATHIATGIGLFITVSIMGIGFMTALPLLTTMISLATDPQRQGLTQGTAASASSLLRFAGPLLSGTLVSAGSSFGLPYLAFWFLTSINVICLFVFWALERESLERIASGQE